MGDEQPEQVPSSQNWEGKGKGPAISKQDYKRQVEAAIKEGIAAIAALTDREKPVPPKQTDGPQGSIDLLIEIGFLLEQGEHLQIAKNMIGDWETWPNAERLLLVMVYNLADSMANATGLAWKAHWEDSESYIASITNFVQQIPMEVPGPQAESHNEQPVRVPDIRYWKGRGPSFTPKAPKKPWTSKAPLDPEVFEKLRADRLDQAVAVIRKLERREKAGTPKPERIQDPGDAVEVHIEQDFRLEQAENINVVRKLLEDWDTWSHNEKMVLMLLYHLADGMAKVVDIPEWDEGMEELKQLLMAYGASLA